MPQLTIPDVSEFQGNIDWRALVSGGYPAAVIRAHNGSRADKYFSANRSHAHAEHIQALGMYQYVVAGRDAATQAGELCDLVGSLRTGEWLICDLEEGTGDQSGRAHAWLTTVMGRMHDSGATEELYTGGYFLGAHNLAAAGFKRVWVAAYSSSEPAVRHEMWQFTDARKFPGVAHPCDASVFHGSIGQLLSHVNPTPGPAPMTHLLEEEMYAYLPPIAANVDVVIPVEPAGTVAKPQGGARNGPIWLAVRPQGADGTVNVDWLQNGKWVAKQRKAAVTVGGRSLEFSLPSDGSVSAVRYHSTVPLLGYLVGRQVA